MTWTPHTEADAEQRLVELGLKDTAHLFARLSAYVPIRQDLDLPQPLSDPEVMALVVRLPEFSRVMEEGDG